MNTTNFCGRIENSFRSLHKKNPVGQLMLLFFRQYHTYIRNFLLFVFLVNGLFYIPRNSITLDEGGHFQYAVRFVKGHPEKIFPYVDASTMPMSAFNTIPRAVENILYPDIVKSDGGTSDIIHGRYISLIFGLLIGLYVYVWAKDLYGNGTGLFSLFLFVFCPNISAHTSLVTTDGFSALFTISSLYHFWKYTKTKSQSQFIFSCLMLGLAQLAKQSLTYLYLIFFIFFIIRLINLQSRTQITFRNAYRNFILIVLIQLLVINIGFQFNHTGKALNSYSFKSKFFTTIQKGSGFIASIPLPLPSPYLYGLDYTKNMDEIGGGRPEISGKIYLLGTSKEGGGFWNYYFVILFFKTTIPLLIFFIIGLVYLFGKNNETFFNDEMYLLLPVLIFLIYFDFFYKSQVGVRHILMIFPLAHVFSGRIIREIITKTWNKVFVVMLGIYSVVTFYYFFPNLIPYTNEFILDKKMAYKIMAASNLDYGQASGRLMKYLENNPSIKYAPDHPAAGKFIISLFDFLGLGETDKYKWLRKNFTPSSDLAFTYLIFEIPKSSIKGEKLVSE